MNFSFHLKNIQRFDNEDLFRLNSDLLQNVFQGKVYFQAEKHFQKVMVQTNELNFWLAKIYSANLEGMDQVLLLYISHLLIPYELQLVLEKSQELQRKFQLNFHLFDSILLMNDTEVKIQMQNHQENHLQVIQDQAKKSIMMKNESIEFHSQFRHIFNEGLDISIIDEKLSLEENLLVRVANHFQASFHFTDAICDHFNEVTLWQETKKLVSFKSQYQPVNKIKETIILYFFKMIVSQSKLDNFQILSLKKQIPSSQIEMKKTEQPQVQILHHVKKSVKKYKPVIQKLSSLKKEDQLILENLNHVDGRNNYQKFQSIKDVDTFLDVLIKSQFSKYSFDYLRKNLGSLSKVKAFQDLFVHLISLLQSQVIGFNLIESLHSLSYLQNEVFVT